MDKDDPSKKPMMPGADIFPKENLLLPSGVSPSKAEQTEFRVLPHPEGESMLE